MVGSALVLAGAVIQLVLGATRADPPTGGMASRPEPTGAWQASRPPAACPCMPHGPAAYAPCLGAEVAIRAPGALIVSRSSLRDYVRAFAGHKCTSAELQPLASAYANKASNAIFGV
jgi:hypothetical protein